MFKLVGALAAMMTSLSGGAGEGARGPIHLVAEPAGEGVRVRVVGSSEAPYAAAFSLEVTSGGNRSLHRGSASLDGGQAVTLSTVTLGNASPGQWRAHLSVVPEGAPAYEEVRDSF
jgi:hypothetical protein